VEEVMANDKTPVAEPTVSASIISALTEMVKKKGGTEEDVWYLATLAGQEFLSDIASQIVEHQREIPRVGAMYAGNMDIASGFPY